MKQLSFSDRLNKAMLAGELTVSNLALWFERTRPTVQTWTTGRDPRGFRGVRAFNRLALLERAIRDRMGFPIPPQMNDKERATHVMERLNALRRHEAKPGGADAPVRRVSKAAGKRAANGAGRSGRTVKRRKLVKKAGRTGAKSARSRSPVSARHRATAKAVGDRHRPNGPKIRRSQPKPQRIDQHTPDVPVAAEETAH